MLESLQPLETSIMLESLTPYALTANKDQVIILYTGISVTLCTAWCEIFFIVVIAPYH